MPGICFRESLSHLFGLDAVEELCAFLLEKYADALGVIDGLN